MDMSQEALRTSPLKNGGGTQGGKAGLSATAPARMSDDPGDDQLMRRLR